jgi:hypothetical protein
MKMYFYRMNIFFISALDGVKWSASDSSHFTPTETALDTHGIGDWVGPRISLDEMVKRKTQIPAKNQTLVVQSTDHHFTD